MRPLHYPYFWLGAGITLMALVLAFALLPHAPRLPSQHLLAFLFFSVWFSGVFESRWAPGIFIGLLAYGVLIEALQSLTMYRSPAAMDVVADAGGIAAGMVLATAGLGSWCGWVERWLGARAMQ